MFLCSFECVMLNFYCLKLSGTVYVCFENKNAYECQLSVEKLYQDIPLNNITPRYNEHIFWARDTETVMYSSGLTKRFGHSCHYLVKINFYFAS